MRSIRMRFPSPASADASGGAIGGSARLADVDVVADVDLPCSDVVLFGFVDDLSRYPQWLDIVARAEPLPVDPGDTTARSAVSPKAVDLDASAAWAVDLRGRLGPLARSKRLRMVRTEMVVPERAVFERAELDGRRHSPWRLAVDVTPTDGTTAGSHLRMQLHYGGTLLGPVVERLLRDEIERSKGRLAALVASI